MTPETIEIVGRAIAAAGGFDYERGETRIVMDKYAKAAIQAYVGELQRKVKRINREGYSPEEMDFLEFNR